MSTLPRYKIGIDPGIKLSESQLQQQCVRWFRTQYNGFAKLLIAIPNGGKRNAREAKSLQRQGVMPGVPDLLLAHASKCFHSLFIEMKVGYNKPSPLQDEMISLLRREGFEVAVCYSLDDFIDVVTNYLR